MAADHDPLNTPGRIAFAGDWHGSPRWSISAVEHAADDRVNTIVHCGDFGYLFHPRFVGPLSRALATAGINLLFIDGNHDDHKMLAGLPTWPSGLRKLAERIWYVPRGLRWEWDGIRFLGLGGAHSVDTPVRLHHGLAWWKEETITEAQAEYVIAGGRADVMVTHDCPAGILIPGLQESAGWFTPTQIALADQHRTRLRGIVDHVRPALLVHGHYHRAYSVYAGLGWPMTVVGLDCDGTTFNGNLAAFDLEELRDTIQPEGTGR